MAGEKKEAINELKTGLEKFKNDALKKGWEQDEVDEKIKEVFENFPWYKYKPNKQSWKSRIFNFCIFALIAYLAYGAVMERNRRWKKRIDDYIFDSQLSYRTHRVMRILALPLFKVFDLSKFHDQDCIINNPFKTKENIDCAFCQGIEEIPLTKVDSPDVLDMLNEEEPFLLEDVKDYYDTRITFQDLKEMFEKNPLELDEAVCSIKKNTEFKSISEFFNKVSNEKSMNEKGLSIEWSNCDTYGTRFYRRIFKRPTFISKESEISFEKRIFMLQKDQNSTIENAEGKFYYLYQVQGQSLFEMKSDSECHYNCTEDPITATLNQGNMVVFPIGGWSSSFKALGEGLNILFLSSFT